jgi:putative oxidoreductase
VVAYATSEQEALSSLVHGNPDPFFAAAPFLFLFAAVLIWIFGPGRISLDAVVAKIFPQKNLSAGRE